MKIGIIVYSQTGNTLSVAELLRDKLSSKGHFAAIEQLKPVGGPPKDPSGIKSLKFETLPDAASYDALVLAAPVQAFSLCAPMAAYLLQLPTLTGKKVACFVTKQLSSAWTGGNKAIGTMKKACQAKGAVVCGTGIVSWKSKQRDLDIDKLVDSLSCLFN